MSKFIISFLLAIIKMQHVLCMHSDQNVLKIALPYLFEPCLTLKQAKSHLDNISLVNKNLHAHVNRPDITRSIITTISHGHKQDQVAFQLATPGTRNYLTQSEKLYNTIGDVEPNQIDDLLSAGADINYSPALCPPLLFKACSNLINTQHLLQCGANADVEYDPNITLLDIAIKDKNIPLITLLCSYPLQKKCLDRAVLTKNAHILHAITQQHFTKKELSQGLKTAIILGNKEAIPVLIETSTRCLEKRNLDIFIEKHIHHAFAYRTQQLLGYPRDLKYIDNNEKNTLSIITLLCAHTNSNYEYLAIIYEAETARALKRLRREKEIFISKKTGGPL